EGPRRPNVAGRRCASLDHHRLLPGESVFAEAERFKPTLRRRLKQDIGLGQKRPQVLAVDLPIEVEYYRAFAAIVLPEEQRAFRVWLVLVEWADAACWVATGRLDLEHISGESPERQAAIIPHLNRHPDSPGARERSGLR